jgi:ATP-binding cassette subfamily B protein
LNPCPCQRPTDVTPITHADKIFGLEKGHVVESGQHFDRLLQKGIYYGGRQQIGEKISVEV